MKRALWAAGVVLLLCLGVATALAAIPENLETFTYQDDCVRYWTTQDNEVVTLWGQYQRPAGPEQEISTHVLGIYMQDDYLFICKDADPENAPGEKVIVYLISWYSHASKGMQPWFSFCYDVSKFTEESVAQCAANSLAVGICPVPESDLQGVYTLDVTHQGLLTLRIFPIENEKMKSYFQYYQLAKSRVAGYHQEGYFYYVDNTSALYTLSPSDMDPLYEKPAGTKLAVVQRGSLPVAGSGYLGWVSSKGALGYSLDGKTAQEFSAFPKDTAFAFFQDRIIAAYSDLWLGEITPGQGARPINQETLDEITKANRSIPHLEGVDAATQR